MTLNDLEHYNRGFYGFYICSQWAFIHALLSRVPFALARLSCFVSPRDLRAPWADRRETLPRYRKVLVFDKVGPKFLGALRPKKLGPKTCKIWVDFGPLQSSIAYGKLLYVTDFNNVLRVSSKHRPLQW